MAGHSDSSSSTSSSAGHAPLFTSSNGVHNLAMNTLLPEQDGPPNVLVWNPLSENTYSFTTLAFCVNLGIKILESPSGRGTLARLGCDTIAAWNQTQRSVPFSGDVHLMHSYIDHFLSRLRENCPILLVTTDGFGNDDSLAYCKRVTIWDGNLMDYQPKSAVALYYNSDRIAAMARAAEAYSRHRSTDRCNRYQTFLFTFSIVSAHELVHAFVGYLAQGTDDPQDFTPPPLTHLDYAESPAQGEDASGESGRWFESQVFGGAPELYRNSNEDDGQCGMPYIVDSNAMAFRVTLQGIQNLLEQSRPLSFPLSVEPEPLSPQERTRQNLRSLGYEQSRIQRQVGRPYMIARNEVAPAVAYAPRILHNVPATSLAQIATNPRPLNGTCIS